jgi:short-subunit dehydrogenase
LDLSSPEAVDTLYQAIQSTGRPVDAIALNAGVGVSGPFIETDLEAEYNLIRLNIVSVVHLAKCVLRDMVRRGTGRMLFTSSIAGEMPGPFYAVYAASKAFIQSFSEALRTEVKDTGVTITALQPGATDTNFFARAGMLDTKAGQSKKDNAADVARDGYEALMAGKDHVVAGSFKNKIQVGVGKLVSEAQGATLQAPQTRPLRKGA